MGWIPYVQQLAGVFNGSSHHLFEPVSLVKHMEKFELPSLPLKVSLEEITQLVQDELDANNWGEIPVPIPEIELIPYYVFQFDSFSEAEEEGTKIRSVDESTQGINSLNAVKNELDEVIAEMASPEVMLSVFEVPSKIKAFVKNPRFSLDEAKGAAQIKIAAQEKVARGNVHITGMHLVYVPFWVCKITLDEDNQIKLRINGMSGEFEGEESGIPYQGSTATELAKETLSDLQSPQGWVEHASGLAHDIILLFQPSKEHPNRWMAILVLVVIALVLFGIGFITWPAPA